MKVVSKEFLLHKLNLRVFGNSVFPNHSSFLFKQTNILKFEDKKILNVLLFLNTIDIISEQI